MLYLALLWVCRLFVSLLHQGYQFGIILILRTPAALYLGYYPANKNLTNLSLSLYCIET